nr:putative integron gene cassette protein [uncultured bacterium]
MLQEYRDVKQLPGEVERRWFYCDDLDLIVWQNDSGSICGFHLCYDKKTDEKAIVWHETSGYSHYKVDSGEDHSKRLKATPILLSDGIFEAERITLLFSSEANNIDPMLSSFVHAKLVHFKNTYSE